MNELKFLLSIHHYRINMVEWADVLARLTMNEVYG